MGFFDNAKQLYEMQKKAKAVKQQLGQIQVEAEESAVKVVFNGEQEMLECHLPEEAAHLAPLIVNVVNRAIKKSQVLGAEKMKEVMGGMGGLFGGAAPSS